MIQPPLDPASEVVDTRRRWTVDWYSWLGDLVNEVTRLFSVTDSSIAAANLAISDLETTVSGLEADVAALETAVATLETDVAALSAPKASFSAHKNGTAQTGIADSTSTKLTFGTEEWDVGGYYDTTTSRWTPPAGLVQIIGNAAFTGGVADGSLYAVGVYKSGTILRWGNEQVVGAASEPFLSVVCLDVADGDDYYEIWAYGSGGGDKTVSGINTYTYFQGHLL